MYVDESDTRILLTVHLVFSAPTPSTNSMLYHLLPFVLLTFCDRFYDANSRCWSIWLNFQASRKCIINSWDIHNYAWNRFIGRWTIRWWAVWKTSCNINSSDYYCYYLCIAIFSWWQQHYFRPSDLRYAMNPNHQIMISIVFRIGWW